MLRYVFLFTIISFFGTHNGVKSLTEEDVSHMKKLRHYDVSQFSTFGIDDFDVFGRQCFLALNVYLFKELYNKRRDNTSKDCTEDEANKNFDGAIEYSSKMFRILNVETMSIFNFDYLTTAHKKITDFKNKHTSQLHRSELNTSVLEIIERGIKQYLWSTEKEVQIIDEYRELNDSKLTLAAYDTCYHTLKGFSTLEAITDTRFKDPVAKEFGNVLLLMSPDELNNMQNAKVKLEKIQILKPILTTALKNIYQAVNNVFDKIEFPLNRIPKLENFPEYTNLRAELLVILKQLAIKINYVTQETYLLCRIMGNNDNARQSGPDTHSDTLMLKYMEFVSKFDLKLSLLFDKESKIKEVTNKLKNELSSRTGKESNVESDPTKLSNLFDNFRIQPSLMRYYAKNYDSWTHTPPDASNINHIKLILYESNLWLTVIKYNVSRMIVYAKAWFVVQIKEIQKIQESNQMKQKASMEPGAISTSWLSRLLQKLRWMRVFFSYIQSFFFFAKNTNETNANDSSAPEEDDSIYDMNIQSLSKDDENTMRSSLKLNSNIWKFFTLFKDSVEESFKNLE